MITQMLDHALAYAAKGYYIFPCKPNSKEPLTPHGHKDATTDEETIRQWWTKWPESNIGLSLEPSGLMVVDLDRHPGQPDGLKALNELRQNRPIPGPVSYTGGDGLHCILKKPAAQVKGKPLPGVDVKTKGYIILPPSLHPSGKTYQWKEGRSLLECEPLDAPEWLLPSIVKGDTTELASAVSGQYPSSSGEFVIERCPFMRQVVDNAESLSEPEWYQSIGVLAYTVEAPEIVHKYSKPHPGYSFGDTEAKMNHWKQDGKGPPTCRTIQEKCGDDYCKRCPYNGDIKSPIVLGYVSRPSENARAVKPFPVDALPDVFQQFALSAATALQCPVDYIGCSLLAVASILIGGKRRIQLEPEWCQLANLWISLIGSPSSKKSPALEKAFAVVRKIEKELYAEYRRDLGLYEMKFRQYEVDLKNWKSDPSGDPPIKPDKPAVKRLTTSDSTVEALGELLANNPHGIALVCDELSSWMRSMNQYKGGQGADRSHYLEMWSNAQMTIDRKSKEPIIVPLPYLTLIGGIQPDVLLEMSSQGIEDGLKERFLFSCPPANTEEPTTGIEIPAEIRNSLNACLRKIFEARPSELDTIPLSNASQEVFLEARREWHGLIHSEGFPAEMEAYYVKMGNYIGRFALIIHEIKRATGETNADMVEEETMLQAKSLADYFLNHAHVALGMVMQTREEQQVEKTALWIRKKGLHVVSPRDLTTNKVAGCRKASLAKGVLQALQDYGFGYWNPEKDRLIFFHDSVSISANDMKA